MNGLKTASCLLKGRGRGEKPCDTDTGNEWSVRRLAFYKPSLPQCTAGDLYFMFMPSSACMYLLVRVFARRVQVLLYLLHGSFQLVRTEGWLSLFVPPANTHTHCWSSTLCVVCSDRLVHLAAGYCGLCCFYNLLNWWNKRLTGVTWSLRFTPVFLCPVFKLLLSQCDLPLTCLQVQPHMRTCWHCLACHTHTHTDRHTHTHTHHK